MDIATSTKRDSTYHPTSAEFTGYSSELPSPNDYEKIEHEYLASITSRKRQKALITQEMFDNIWDVLHDPHGSLMTSQFRFWVRKMFTLATLDMGDENLDGDVNTVILHENRPVAVKTQIYDILCYCHRLCEHGGRDRTTATVRAHFSWIPKELVARFVKICPKCSNKKAGYWGIVPKGSKAKHERAGIIYFDDSSLIKAYAKNDETEVDFNVTSKKREAWNKQPAIDTEIPLKFIFARFPQPTPSTPNILSPNLDTNKLNIYNTKEDDHLTVHQDCSPWLAELVGLSPDEPTTIRRSQSTADASYPSQRDPSRNIHPLVTSISAGPPTDYRSPFLVRPVRRRYHGHDTHSPSPVFSDDEEYCSGLNEYVVYPGVEEAQEKENDWSAIDPVLLDNSVDPGRSDQTL
ncbi:hypothetical protein QCA50_016072 [Cerrena zonata]|uniref:Integrase zinc-binding domain-containing protein n=1 Tax=Cerrena zonata TaxID=2478898 RepID=A0AAW0FP18_9APHY